MFALKILEVIVTVLLGLTVVVLGFVGSVMFPFIVNTFVNTTLDAYPDDDRE